MYEIKRAIIMAAGTGSRMRPLTLKTPKPLIEVNGTRMIDTVIDSLLYNKIEEIYIVVGYLKEQFNCLLSKYPTVQLIENPFYDKCNNISSLYVAREHLEDVIILDGDQVIFNKDILTKNYKGSSYNCIWTNSKTDEWLLTLDNGFVKSCSRTGGLSGWQLFSISRWTAEDGKKLKKHLEIEFIDNKNTQIYWDDVALFCYPNEYKLQVVEMSSSDVIEIDSYEELLEYDGSYNQNKGEVL